METTPSSGSETYKQSQIPSLSPKQLIEKFEQVSGRESRSKSATLTRSRYDDDPEDIDPEEDIYDDGMGDISNKVRIVWELYLIIKNFLDEFVIIIMHYV